MESNHLFTQKEIQMSLAEDLAQLSRMKAAGELSESEFEEAKRRVLMEHTSILDDEDRKQEPKPELELEPELQAAAHSGRPNKKPKKFLGLGVFGWLIFVSIGIVGINSVSTQSTQQRRETLRVENPTAYAALIKEEEAKAAERAAVKAKQEAELVAKEAAREAEEVAKKAAVEEKEAANRRSGFHCLSSWDGSHRRLVEWTKENLNDPGSFEHDETRIAPVTADGTHTIYMQYRARNGFGGMVRGTTVAKIQNEGCNLAEIVSSN
jgi:hypothetical protein